MEKYKIDALKNKKVNNLSGGEKQRVAVVRSLINNPNVIFADEPTGNLDKENSVIVMNLLKEISKNQLVVVVSHNKSLIEKYSDGSLDLTNGTQNSWIPMTKIDNKTCIIKKNTKASFVPYMLPKSFKKNLKVNLLSLLSMIFAFLIVFLSIGFNNGIMKNSEGIINSYQNYNSYKISKVLYKLIPDSNLKMEKTIKPKKNEIIDIVNGYEDYTIVESLDYFFNDKRNAEINNKVIENVSFIPVNNIPNGNVVYVNNAFKEVYEKKNKGSCLNRFLLLNLKRTYSFNNIQSEGPNIIDEVFEGHFEFYIEKIRYEFSYLNYPKVYFSYNYFVDYLKQYKCTKINQTTKSNYNFFDILVNAKDDEDVSGYSYILYLDNIEDAKKFNRKISSFKEYSIKNEPYITINFFKEMTSAFFKGILLFIGISILCSLTIVGFLSFSSFVFNRKQTAILSTLGAVKNDVILVYLIEKVIVLFIAFFVSYFLIKILSLSINNYIYARFYFQGIIVFPFNNNQVSINVLVASLFFIILVVTIPLLMVKNNEIYKELKEE